eukprot:g4736.t1
MILQQPNRPRTNVSVNLPAVLNFMADDSFGEDPEAMSDDSFNADPGHDYDDNDDGFGDDFVPEAKAEFEVWDQKRAQKELQTLVEEVSDLLGTDLEVSSLLLRHHKWNPEKLQGNFFENSEKVMSDCGLQMYSIKPKKTSSEVQCTICYDEVAAEIAAEKACALGCSHWYCADCWKGFLADKVESGRSCIESTCPAYKCPVRVPDSVAERFLKDQPKVLAKYKEYLLRSFVEDSRNMKWCPQPRCEYIIKASGATKTVACKCGGKFCFTCNEEAHAPAECAKLSQWLGLSCRNR